MIFPSSLDLISGHLMKYRQELEIFHQVAVDYNTSELSSSSKRQWTNDCFVDYLAYLIPDIIPAEPGTAGYDFKISSIKVSFKFIKNDNEVIIKNSRSANPTLSVDCDCFLIMDLGAAGCVFVVSQDNEHAYTKGSKVILSKECPKIDIIEKGTMHSYDRGETDRLNELSTTINNILLNDMKQMGEKLKDNI